MSRTRRDHSSTRHDPRPEQSGTPIDNAPIVERLLSAQRHMEMCSHLGGTYTLRDMPLDIAGELADDPLLAWLSEDGRQTVLRATLRAAVADPATMGLNWPLPMRLRRAEIPGDSLPVAETSGLTARELVAAALILLDDAADRREWRREIESHCTYGPNFG